MEPIELIDINQEELVMIGYVFCWPLKAQFISTSIKVVIELDDYSSKIVNVEIPIIGSVVNYTNIFSTVEYQHVEPNDSLPRPLYIIDSN